MNKQFNYKDLFAPSTDPVILSSKKRYEEFRQYNPDYIIVKFYEKKILDMFKTHGEETYKVILKVLAEYTDEVQAKFLSTAKRMMPDFFNKLREKADKDDYKNMIKTVAKIVI